MDANRRILFNIKKLFFPRSPESSGNAAAVLAGHDADFDFLEAARFRASGCKSLRRTPASGRRLKLELHCRNMAEQIKNHEFARRS